MLTEQAISFLKERLLAIPSVRHAFLERRYDEMGLWVLVDGSRSEARRRVVHETCEAMMRFSDISITSRVLPLSHLDDFSKPPNAFQLLSR